jgi:site-specific DNA recombinase
MISERTRDKMGAARRKGKWVGGNPVIGYDVAPQGGSLVVNQEEAQRVRDIFALYLELGSLIPVVEELDRRGWRMKSWTTRGGREAGGKPIPKNSLYNLLTNMVYVGKVEYGGQVYQGEHDRIVDDATWNRVQSALSRNGRRGGRNIGNKYSALLKGLVRCGSCDVGMVHTYVNKKDKLYRYYVCVKAHQRGWAQCETRSVSAPALENAVVEQLRGIGRNPTVLCEVLRQLTEHRQKDMSAIESDKSEIERELKKITQEIKETASRAGSAGPSGELATGRLADLQDCVSRHRRRLGELRQQSEAIEAEGVDAKDVEVALQDFGELWEQLSTWEQERFIRTLVDHVLYNGKTGTVTLSFHSRGIRDCCGLPARTEKHEHAKQRS